MHVLEREVVTKKIDKTDLSLALTFLASGSLLVLTGFTATPELGWFRTLGIVIGFMFLLAGLLFLAIWWGEVMPNQEHNEELARLDQENPGNWDRWDKPR